MRTRSRRGAAQLPLPLDVTALALSYLDGGGALRILLEKDEQCSAAALDDAFDNIGETGQTVKSLLCAAMRRPLRVPEQFTLTSALAAARDGDTILISANVDLDPPRIALRVPNIKLRIVGARRPRWTFGRNFGGSERDPKRWGAVEINACCIGEAVFHAEGNETRLTLERISFIGVSRDYWHTPGYAQPEPEGARLDMDAHDTALNVTNGARVKIDECAFTRFGRAAVTATDPGSSVEIHDTYFSRSYCPVGAKGAGAVLSLTRCRVIGECMYGAMATEGARVEVWNSTISSPETPCRHGGIVAMEEGSTIKVDRLTWYDMTRPIAGTVIPFMLVFEDATLIVQCYHLQRMTSFVNEDSILDCMEGGENLMHIPPDDVWATIRSMNHPSDMFQVPGL